MLKIFAAFVMLCTMNVQAACLMIPLSPEALTDHAQVVAQGTALSRTCLRDSGNRIYTSVEFQVASVWKGELATNRITVVYSGGVLGEQSVQTPGEVDLKPGEEAIVFLVLNPSQEWVCVGMSQGKFQVWQEAGSGRKLVSNPFLGTSYSAGTAAVVTAQAASSTTNSGTLALDDLKQAVLRQSRVTTEKAIHLK